MGGCIGTQISEDFTVLRMRLGDKVKIVLNPELDRKELDMRLFFFWGGGVEKI